MVIRRWRERQGSFPQGGGLVPQDNPDSYLDDDGEADDDFEVDPVTLPPDVEPRLASAWFARRQRQLRDQRRRQAATHRARQAAGLVPLPVDVDNPVVTLLRPSAAAASLSSDWDLAETVAAPHYVRARHGGGGGNSKRGAAPEVWSYDTEDEQAAAAVHMTSTSSIALSDCTPVTNNREYLQQQQQQQQQHQQQKQTPHTSFFHGPDYVARAYPPPPSSESDYYDPPSIVSTTRCGGVFDWRRWQGKAFCSLLLLLTICVIALLSTAIVVNGRGGNASAVGNFGAGGPAPPSATAPTTVSPVAPLPGDHRPVTPPHPPPPLATATPAAVTALPTATPTLPTTTPIERPTVSPTGSTNASSPSPSSSPSAAAADLSRPPSVTARLQVTDTVEGVEIGDMFGSALALSADGKVLAVGAQRATANHSLAGAGRVQVYEWTGTNGTWRERGAPIGGDAAGDHTGFAVALSYAGEVLALSEPKHAAGAGRVRVYAHNVGSGDYDIAVGQELQGEAPSVYFGTALALFESGRKLVITSPFYSGSRRFQGRVQAYEFGSGKREWTALGRPLLGSAPGEWFGSSMALYEDATTATIAVNAPHNSHTDGHVLAYQFDKSQQEFVQLGGNEMTNKNAFASSNIKENYGYSLALSKTNSTFRVAVGVPFKNNVTSGRVKVGVAALYYLNKESSAWTAIGSPITSDATGDLLGSSVKLLDGGDHLLVGAPGSIGNDGSVRVFRYEPSSQSYTPVSDRSPSALMSATPGARFGAAVDAVRRVDDGRLVVTVGATRSDDGGPGFVSILEDQ